jgi:hypothetical protein
MATGDDEDMQRRFAAVLPPWFGAPGEAPPVVATVAAMPARVAAWLYRLIGYARRQTRIRTAEGGWLDLIAFDFFGRRVARRGSQSDVSLRAKIVSELFRPRGTRGALARMLTDLTGREPRIFEPERPADTGGVGTSFMGVSVAGRVGTMTMPGTVFVDALRTPDAGIPNAAGVGTTYAGVGVVGSLLVVSALDQVRGTLTDADVFAAVEAVRPAGIKVWLSISD